MSGQQPPSALPNSARCWECCGVDATPCLPVEADDRLFHASRSDERPGGAHRGGKRASPGRRCIRPCSGLRLPCLQPLMDPVGEFLGTLEVERGASPNTLLAYRRDLASYRNFLGREGRDLESVGIDDLTRYLGWLRRRGLGSRSVARHLAAIRGLYRHLLAAGVISRD